MASNRDSRKQDIRIGVTGHRILTDLDRIHAGIEKAIREVEQAFPGRPLTILSSLAEGADRLVAKGVLHRPGARLVVPLPLPAADYAKDFASDESRAEFDELLARASEVLTLPSTPTRNAAYEAAGCYIVDHCDVLIAVWDGQSAQGQGGTAEIVAKAREQGKPLLVVRAGNRKPDTQEPTTLGEEQGRVVVERLSGV
jgi:hypothetical protein